jgi:hypothetical protein
MSRIGFGLLGLVMLALGVGGYALGAHLNTLTCTRSDGRCIIERVTLWNTSVSAFPVGELLGAEVSGPKIVAGSNVRPGAAAMLKLRTTKGLVNFMDYATEVKREEMEEQAALISAFAGNPSQQTLRVRRDDRLTGVLIGFIPFLIGVAIVVATILGKIPGGASAKVASP